MNIEKRYSRFWFRALPLCVIVCLLLIAAFFSMNLLGVVAGMSLMFSVAAYMVLIDVEGGSTSFKAGVVMMVAFCLMIIAACIILFYTYDIPLIVYSYALGCIVLMSIYHFVTDMSAPQ